jgi:hypothetical protein
MPEALRYRANRDLTVEQDGKEPLSYPAGEECRNAPAGWPQQWLIDEGWVSPIAPAAKKTTKSSPAAGASEENA